MKLSDFRVRIYHKSFKQVILVQTKVYPDKTERTYQKTFDSKWLDTLSYDELYNSEVLMFEAVKKGVIKVWTIYEVN